MTTSAVELVKRYYDSLTLGRRGTLSWLLAADFSLELQEGFPGARPRYTGHKEYLEDFLGLVYGALDFEFQPETFLASEGHVVALGRMKGRASSTSVAFDVPFAHLWTVTERQLSGARFFTDTAVLRDAIAGVPSPTRK